MFKELIERLCAVTDALGDVGKHIDNSVKAYNRSINSLESHLFVVARKFRELCLVVPSIGWAGLN